MMPTEKQKDAAWNKTAKIHNVVLLIASLSVLACILGSTILPWATYHSKTLGDLTAKGFSAGGDAHVILILAVAATATLVRFYFTRSKRASEIAFVLGIIIAGFGMKVMIHFARVMHGYAEPAYSFEFGLYLVVVSGLILTACAALLTFKLPPREPEVFRKKDISHLTSRS